MGVLCRLIGVQEGMRHVHGLSAADARAGAKRLEAILSQQSSFAEIVTAERDTVWEGIKIRFQQESIEPVSWTDRPKLSGFPASLAYRGAILFCSKQGIIDDYSRYTDTLIAHAQLPYQRAKQQPVAVPHNLFLRLLSPDIIVEGPRMPVRAFGQYTSVSAKNRVLLARLAIQAYRQEHGGTAPASLERLIEGANPYLRSVPIDPYSMDGATPLHYNPANGDVYSVGENGVDDGDRGDDADVMYGTR